MKFLLLVLSITCFQVLNAKHCHWTKEQRELDCCQLGPDNRPSEEEKVFKECHGKHHDKILGYVDFFDACGEECILKTEGFMDADNKPDLNKLLEAHKENKEEINMKAVEHCMKEQANWKDDDQECKSGARMSAHCIDTYRFLHCPNFKDSAECKAVKSTLEECHDELLMPPRSYGIGPAPHH